MIQKQTWRLLLFQIPHVGCILSHGLEVKKTQQFLIWSILTIAVIFDGRSYRIPNQLIILGYLAGIYINIVSYGMVGIVYFIAKAIWPIALLSILYLLGRQLGAGDIKLFSVMATLVGADITVDTMILSVILAALAIAILSLRERQLIKRKLHYSFYMAAAFFLLQYR